MKITHILLVLIIFSLLAFPAAPETDFSGKTIEWINPFKEGGGSELWAKFNAPFLSKYLPGNPRVVIKNIPGSGSIRAANAYATNASSDGLAIFGTSASTQFPYLLGDPRVHYDYEQWVVLMVYPTGGVFYTTTELGIDGTKELTKLKEKRLVYASVGATSVDLVSLLGFELLGLEVRTFFGVWGRGAARLAFERKETNLDFQTSASYIQHVMPKVETGEVVPLFTLGVLNREGNLVRDPEFPDLPHFAEVYEILNGKPPQGLAWETWFAFFSAGFGAQKLLVLPKSTPPDVVRTYRNAIRLMQKDPEYLAAKNAKIGAYIQVVGVAAERLYQLATHIPTEQKEWVSHWLREKYNIKVK